MQCYWPDLKNISVIFEENWPQKCTLTCGFCFCWFLVIPEDCSRRDHASGMPCNTNTQNGIRVHSGIQHPTIKGKVKVTYFTSMAKQAKAAFLHGATVWKVADCRDRTRNLSLRKRCTNHFQHGTPTLKHDPLVLSIGLESMQHTRFN